MGMYSRRTIMCALGVAVAMTGAWAPGAAAEERSSVKIGYAISKSGANAGGAGITTIPNYQLWVKEVNEAGGLELPDGSRLPIEVVEYDDRSSSEEVVRAIERLATQDEVDFILAPWGTGFNLAAAPIFDRFGYPQLAISSVTDRAPEFAKRWPRSFWLHGGGSDYAQALVDILAKAADQGTINKQVAMISVAEGFGIDLVNAARPAFEAAGFEIVYDRTYPPGTTDFTPMINEAAATDADSFIAFSYPPDTFALTQQARVANYNPKVLYLGVGTQFPSYAAANGENAEGIMGLGGTDVSNPKVMEYRKRHEEVIGAGPDYWGSVVTYSVLQMLQEAIKRVGLDRGAVTEELSTGTFETVVGEIKLQDNQLRDMWWAGQWQDGHFVALAPADRPGASEPRLPKQPWKPAN
ncbi:amino acid ABC transporter substrate-binding protein [Nitratireductor soli]|uniref:amino acid ABC transporter substrate-binding protein n=1 Tax=Nitratireductor soli TaxID=1670619 RepID=UPI00065E27FD|nr:amino acid ABC transporter substrate-binding protein [Nitratireductor soli]